jgi:hypothetical protein
MPFCLSYRRSYPSISPDIQPILIARSRLESLSLAQFIFSKYENQWLYFFATVLHQEKKPKNLAIDFDSEQPEDDEEEERSGPLPRVNVFTIVLITKVLSINKHQSHRQQQPQQQPQQQQQQQHRCG